MARDTHVAEKIALCEKYIIEQQVIYLFVFKIFVRLVGLETITSASHKELNYLMIEKIEFFLHRESLNVRLGGI